MRKRVYAIRRGPDGSAFEKCGYCGLTVAIALADMHECCFKETVNKRIKSCDVNCGFHRQKMEDQPRSAFRLFMEEYMKKCGDGDEIEADKKGCEIWKNMSEKEREPFVVEANKLNSAYVRLLQEEENEMITWVDDEADSAEVGKCVESHEYCCSDDYDSDGFDASLCFFSETVILSTVK